MKKNQRHKNLCQYGTNYISKKILSNLGRIFKIHFRPSWLEVWNLTSVQVGQKLKSQLRHKLCRSQKSTSAQLAEKSDFNFCTGCEEVEFASRQKARH